MDAFVSTGQGFLGNNMFAYCLNNPVLYYDPDGYETMVYNDRTDGDTLDGLLDAGGGGSGTGCSFANTSNSLDAGYTYHVDLSQASNSSSFQSGIAVNGYTQYQATSSTHTNGNASHFNPDQQAVIALAREYKNGISAREADILVGYAKEYGISNHPPEMHQNRGGYWNTRLHIKIFNMHIQVDE